MLFSVFPLWMNNVTFQTHRVLRKKKNQCQFTSRSINFVVSKLDCMQSLPGVTAKNVVCPRSLLSKDYSPLTLLCDLSMCICDSPQVILMQCSNNHDKIKPNFIQNFPTPIPGLSFVVLPSRVIWFTNTALALDHCVFHSEFVFTALAREKLGYSFLLDF